MIDPDDREPLKKDVGRRLLLSRTVIGLDQHTFASAAGLSQPRYSQYETGRRLLTIEAAIALSNKFSLTLDWLYRGDPSSLPGHMIPLLLATRKAPKTTCVAIARLRPLSTQNNKL